MAVETASYKTVNRAASVLPAAVPRFVQCKPVLNRAPVQIQTALKVSSPKDPAEKEADATAKKIMRMAIPEGSIAHVRTGGSDVFRLVKPEEKDKKIQRLASPYITRFAESGILTQRADREEKKVQRKAEGQPNVASNVAAEIQSSMAGGSPLPLSVRRFMEPRFRADFSQVKIHTDNKAAKLNRQLNAQAFAVGKNVFFGQGKFKPESDEGKELIAHELTHTIQQGAAVQRSEEVSVTQQSPTLVQRLGLSDALDYFADKANLIPGFRMFTIILGVNPINMSSVDRSAANILRAIIEFIPGGGLITQALDNYGIFDKIGNWVEQQIRSLGMTGAAIKQAVTDFLNSLSWSDIFDLGGVWNRAKRIFTAPIDQLINFAKGLVTGIIRFIKDAILRPLASLAEGTRGYDLLKALLGQDPVTGDPVPRTADTLIGGFMKLIGQEDIWNNLKKANAVARAWAWFQGAMSSLLGFVRQIPSLFVQAFQSLELMDIVLLPRAFVKVGAVFGSFIGSFISWAGNAVWNLLEIIFAVVAPGAVPYLKKAAGAFRSILKNPIGFIGNLVRAGKQGFLQFAGRFLTHLKNSLIQWLTGALPGVYIPQALNLREIIKFVLSVLGLTWANVRVKLVKAVGETAVKAMETGFDIVVTLVTQGPAAAWDKIKEALGNLQQMVIDGVMDFVKSKIVTAAVTKLLSMLSPAGAFIQAIIAIYNTIMFFVERLRQIAQVAMSFIDSISAIANGVIAAAANRVETTMAGLLTLVISFLARIAGLGRVSDAVMNIINRVRAPIDRGLDMVVNWIVSMARRLGRFVAQAGVPNDPNERLRLGLDAAVTTVNALSGTQVTESLINPVLGAAKVRYGFTVLRAVEENGEWWIQATINPVRKKKTRFSKAARNKAAQVVGQNINSLTPAILNPEYTKRNYLSFEEVQASSGFSGRVPVVHTDEADIVRQGNGPYRSDYVLIRNFNAAIAKIEADLAALTPPIALQGDKTRPERDLRDKAKSVPQFAHGIRRQMIATMDYLAGSNRLRFRGVEVPLGGNRSIDFTIQKRERGRDINALVEVKNWSGTYDPVELAKKVTRLDSQLKAYVDLAKQGTNNYEMLILDWYGFNSMDATARAQLQAVVDGVRAYARGKVLFRFNKL